MIRGSETRLKIRNTSLGSTVILELLLARSNDCVDIHYLNLEGEREKGGISIGLEDLPEVLAHLQAYVVSHRFDKARIVSYGT